MGIIAGQSLTADFRVFSSTGALVDADSAPTGTLIINGTNNAASVTVTNKTTGQYKAAVTVPATVAIGDCVQLAIAATVSSVASGGMIFTDTVDLPPTNQMWYVRTTGSNSNHGRSPGAAKLTIAAAVTAASDGDTINIGAGTFNETISVTKQLIYVGVGRGQTVWTNTGATLTLSTACGGSKFYDLSIISSGTTAAGITATGGVHNLYFENCYVEGYLDAITHHSSKGFKAVNCEFVGDWDGLGQNDATEFLVENCIVKTTGEYTWNGSSYTGDLAMQGAQCSGGSGTFRNCKLIGERQHATNQITAAISSTNGQVLLDNCYLSAIVYSDTTTGTIVALNHNTGGVVELRNVRFQSAQDTLDPETATVRDIVHSSGSVVMDRGSNVTVAKISGDGSYIRATDTGLGWTSTLAGNLNTRIDVASSTLATAASLTSLAGKFTGITSLTNWLKAMIRKSAPDATAATEIGGTYDATTDSLEGIKDAGVEVDEAAVAAAVWTTATRTLTTTMSALSQSPFVATKDLPAIPDGSGPAFQWTISDSSGTAVNLSGKTVRFVVASVDEGAEEFSRYDDTLTGEFQYQSGTAALVVSGASNNVVTVQTDSDDITAIGAGEHRYWMWDVTTAGAEKVLVKGKFPVEPAVRSV
jgi:hypothetical protein